MIGTDEQHLIELHDEAAFAACGWRKLQEILEEVAAEIIPSTTHPDHPAAMRAVDSLMGRMRAEEGEAAGRMMRLRERLGRRPPRRVRTTK